MNLLFASFIVRRGLAAVLSIGAVFFGYHTLNKAESNAADQSVASQQKSIEKSAAAAAQAGGVSVKGLPKPSTKDVTSKRSGDKLELTGADGTKVTVKGLPTTGQ